MRLLGWGVGVLALAGCTDVQAPQRAERYEWRLAVNFDSAGPRQDTLSFRWPQSALPVRIWVQDSAGMPDHIRSAIDDWRDAFLYGEFDARLVDDSMSADVIVRVATPPGSQPFGVARLLSAFAPECQGATDLDLTVEPGVRTLRLPIRVYLNERLDTAGLDACYHLTARHELGHALGIWRHAPDADDVMFGDPSANALSDADRQTIEYLYHFPTEITLTR
jgi:predicted Zn-dependent protease